MGAGIATSVGIALLFGFAWIDLGAAGGLGQSPKWALADYRKERQSDMSQLTLRMSQLDPAYDNFQKAAAMHRRFPKENWWEYEMYAVNTHNLSGLAQTDTFDVALESWNKYAARRQTWEQDVARDKIQISAIDQSKNRVFDPVPALSAFGCGFAMTLFALVINLFVVGLRKIRDLLKYRPRRQIA